MEGKVYVLGLKGKPDIAKVGMTTGSVEARASSLQTGNPDEIYVHAIFTVTGGDVRGAERLCHELLKPYRMRGEWFQISPDLASRIMQERLVKPDNSKDKGSATGPGETLAALGLLSGVACLIWGFWYGIFGWVFLGSILLALGVIIYATIEKIATLSSEEKSSVEVALWATLEAIKFTVGSVVLIFLIAFIYTLFWG